MSGQGRRVHGTGKKEQGAPASTMSPSSNHPSQDAVSCPGPGAGQGADASPPHTVSSSLCHFHHLPVSRQTLRCRNIDGHRQAGQGRGLG